MNYIVDFIVELLIEGTYELSRNKKTPSWLKYPLIIIFFLIFLGSTALIFLTAYLSLKEQPLIGIILFIIGLIYSIAFIYKFIKIYSKRNPSSKVYKLWNKFIEVICSKKTNSLNETQRKAVICFKYDCEMSNGGHKKAFETHPILKKNPDEIYNILKEVSNKKIANNYLEATKVTKEYDYKQYDDKYQDISPCLTEYLEDYIIKNKELIFEGETNER